MIEFLGVVFFWFALALAAGAWAERRGRSAAGWLLFAIFFTPVLAFIFLAVLPNRGAEANAARIDTPTPATHIQCPDCAELVRREARVCKHCGCKLSPQPAPEVAQLSAAGTPLAAADDGRIRDTPEQKRRGQITAAVLIVLVGAGALTVCSQSKTPRSPR